MTAHRSRRAAKTKPAAALVAGILALVASAAAAEPSSPSGLFDDLAKASAQATRAVHRAIPFEATCLSRTCARALSRAATATSAAIAQISTLPDSRNLLDAVLRVRLAEGPKASIMLTDSVLSVTVAPAAEESSEWPSPDQIVQSFRTAPK
ncbi:MAG TPA: DUF4908 domain-containing protein [Phenylobacterium sp.]|jgi:hypothetical protein